VPEIEHWFVYVVRCGDGTLYTGIAKDVAARIGEHERGMGAKYTRGRGPFVLCAKRRCQTKGAALRLELAVKALTREEKERRVTTRSGLGAFARALNRRGKAAG
jgi:predicted GIY-YIG superfamily endonuclease